uniref:TATA box-binding protein-like 1 n=1 Tax=Anabas testudineus TaxID=64144 RepID=A0A3Q1IAW5_ANATE
FSLMDESALERYFDSFIANVSFHFHLVLCSFHVLHINPVKQEPKVGFSETKAEVFLLQPLYCEFYDETRQAAESESRTDSSPDYSSQNSTAAGGTPEPEHVDSPVRPMSPVMPVSRVPALNVVSSVRLCCRLDLNLIASKVWNVEYNPKNYKALTMRIRKPRTTAVIYESGYVICTGAKSEEQSRVAIRRFARMVQKLGFPVSLFNLKILNLVASCHTFPVSLERLTMAHRQHCSYEPELFPALFYTVKAGTTLTIWASGKISYSGAKSQAEVYKVFDTIYPVLSCFRRQ